VRDKLAPRKPLAVGQTKGEETTMKKLSEVTPSDFAPLLDSTRKLSGFNSVEEIAQSFVDIVFEQFLDSLVLLRLFCSLPYSALLAQDQQLVDKKANDSGTRLLYKDSTPVLTLLGTRGQRPEWNQRSKSQGFRCIPLVSHGYVASLAMLSMQFKAMNFDLALLDRWDTTIATDAHADDYSGMLYVNHAGIDKDEQGRMIVPHQEFVAEHKVKSTLGFGTGYSDHPTIVMLFAFTNEILNKTEMAPFSSLLQNYLSVSREILKSGKIFSNEARQTVG
jgi:hypothetical protein